MNAPQIPSISVIDPINPAIERVRTILFRPFDLGKWFVIGFCAWLAQLGNAGGGGGNKGRFVLYVLVQMAMAMAIGAMMFMAVCCTCCLAACLFILPYIGTVVLLPIHIFTRSYSLYYLAQYGPEFNVFAPSSDPARPTQSAGTAP